MKILVTGSNGQVGHEFTLLAPHSKHDIVCFDRRGLDITNATQVTAVLQSEQPQVVINCAAYTAVDKAEREVEAAFAINATGAENLAKACRDVNAALIHISTDYVFTGDTLSPYKENDPTGPTGVYGESKLAGEIAIAQQLDKHIILRTAWVFGAHGNNFVKTMLRLGAEREELGVVNDQLGAPTSAKGIAACCMAIANVIAERDAQDVAWGIYHYSGAPHTHWFGFAEHIFATAVRLNVLDLAPKLNQISTDQFPTPAKRPKNSQLNCDKLFNVFHLAPDDWHSQLDSVIGCIKKN